ncbi:MAG TPA: hypothetical protein VFU42_07025, partial [Candidatus Deferrimicrobiaceae bacterium]|nr:hypothetical protein [Candidatus Deferrimicrobiaceae bacterium]
HFGAEVYSLKFLFRDEQRKILNTILEANLAGADAVYRQLHQETAPLVRFLSDIGYPVAKSFHIAAEVALNAGLRRAFEADVLDIAEIKGILYEAETEKVAFDGAGLGYTLRKTIERMMLGFRENPADLDLLGHLDAAVEMGNALPFEVVFWKTQNVYWEMLQEVCPEYRFRASQGDEEAEKWVRLFFSLGTRLSVRLPEE